jgi:hypothetical protein
MTYSLHFSYDKRGHGTLELCKDDDIEMQYESRTGSIDTNGRLINACSPALYYLYDIDGPVNTEHPAMHVNEGQGWWCPFYDASGIRTHVGLHPDGGAGGTLGCIAMVGTDARPLFDRLKEILREQTKMQVFISKQEAV